MKTSLLYHSFGLQSQEYIACYQEQGKTFFKVKTKADKLQCADCKSWNVMRYGTKNRSFRTVPIGRRPVTICAQIQRLYCLDCGSIKQEQIRFADSKKTYTHSFRRYVIELCRISTIQDVANHLGISWDVVKGIHKEFLKKYYSKPDLREVRTIAIDEFATKKGHKYMTVVLDLATGAILHVGKGKGADALAGFWKRVKRAKVNIEAVAMDMSPAYISSVINNSSASIVFDHFHVIKLYNDELSGLRKDLYNQETNLNKKKLLKGTRWLLLKNSENLDKDKDEPKRLQEALEINQPLAAAYYLKEKLGLLWEQDSKAQAELFLENWVKEARETKLPRLNKFASTLMAYRTGILAWYDYPISTAALEGTNNKIKVLKRKAYGYRDEEYFKLRILSLHDLNYALTG